MQKSAKSRVKSLLFSQWFILLLLILAIAAITTAINPKFLTPNNIIGIFNQVASLGLVAVGATILIVSGNFDISVGANLGLTVCCMAIALLGGLPEPLAIVLGLLVATACSLLNGGLSIALKAPSFIISLATSSVFTGIGLLMTRGTIQTIPGKFRFFSATKLFGQIPLTILVCLLGYVIVFILLRYTQTGRQIFAIGANPTAAFLSGINVNRSKLKFFAINGLFIGVASVLYLSRIGSALPSYGGGMELDAMGAVVIGGAPINGGKGDVVGTFLGVLLLGLISNALNMARVDAFFQGIASGLLIVVALTISAVRMKLAAMQGKIS